MLASCVSKHLKYILFSVHLPAEMKLCACNLYSMEMQARKIPQFVG